MQYNIFGTSDEWDEQCLGHIRTIETDHLEQALRHLAEEELLDSEDDDRAGDIRVVVGNEGLQEVYDENEFSCYFRGDEVAYAVLSRDPMYDRVWVAVPAETLKIVIGKD